jgi:hypothetical protein
MQRWDVTVATGDGFMNAVDASDPMVVFQTSYPFNGQPSIVRSTSGGAPNSFEWLSTNGIGFGEPFPWVTPFVIVPGTSATGGGEPSLLLVASNRVYRGVAAQPAGAFSWTQASPILTDSGAVSVLTPFDNGDTAGLFVGLSSGGIWYAEDVRNASPQAGWINVSGNYPGGRISDIAVVPGQPGRVLVTRSTFGGAKLYRSEIGSGSWQAVGQGLPNIPANSVAVDPRYPNRVFVGTDVGVFVSRDFGDTVAPENDGLPAGLVVTDVEVDDAPYAVTVGTYGRGAFQADLQVTLGELFTDGFESGDASAWNSGGS